MKIKFVIAGAIILAALLISAALYIWYIGKMSILDKSGMVYEETSVLEEESEP